MDVLAGTGPNSTKHHQRVGHWKEVAFEGHFDFLPLTP
jgi:hypothetical protein